MLEEEAEAGEVSLGVEARAADSAAPAPGLLAGRDKITGARLAACPGEVVADAALAGACVGRGRVRGMKRGERTKREVTVPRGTSKRQHNPKTTTRRHSTPPRRHPTPPKRPPEPRARQHGGPRSPASPARRARGYLSRQHPHRAPPRPPPSPHRHPQRRPAQSAGAQWLVRCPNAPPRTGAATT